MEKYDSSTLGGACRSREVLVQLGVSLHWDLPGLKLGPCFCILNQGTVFAFMAKWKHFPI